MGWLRIGPIVLAVAFWAAPLAAEGDPPDVVEQTVAVLVNAARDAAGLPPLRPHADLVRAARVQADRMATVGRVFHTEARQLEGVIPWWTRLAENVGMGSSIERIHAMFLASAPHAANMMGDFNYLGVGTCRNSDGRLFVTLIFARIPADRVVDLTDGEAPVGIDLTGARWSRTSPRPLPH